LKKKIREAADIGKNLFNLLSLLRISSKFSSNLDEFSRDVLERSVANLNNNESNRMNFIEILLSNRDNLSDAEINDELKTFIVAVR
jgi:cytochrome P450